jgi:hypothetical protein
MAPELIMFGGSSLAGDVYAFGCTVYQVIYLLLYRLMSRLTTLQVFWGKPPFHEYRYDNNAAWALMSGKVPTRPAEAALDDNIWNLVQACWAQPTERPSAKQIVQRLISFGPGSVDERPIDKWDNPLQDYPSPLAGHPFSTYAPDYEGIEPPEYEESD